MIEFTKKVKITNQVYTGLILSGDINDVINTLRNLSYVFSDCSVSSVNLQEFSEAVKVIKAVKALKVKTKSRRR